MAAASVSSEELRALEQTRQRLVQLGNNIASLKNDIVRSSPLPPVTSFQASASIIGNNIKTLTDHLAKHAHVFSRTVAYPSTNYPGRDQEAILLQLLRKKLEPPVEIWVDEGRRQVERTKQDSAAQDLDSVWSWTRDYIGGRVAKYALEEAGDNYTAEEREMGVENVRTGLRRTLDEEETSSDEEAEDAEMVDVQLAASSAAVVGGAQPGTKAHPDQVEFSGPIRSMDEILRFATTGEVTNHVSLGSR